MRRRAIVALLTALSLLAGIFAEAFASEPLKMGVFPRRGVEVTVRYFKPIADYLGERLGREVMLVTAQDYESFWQRIESERPDIVHLNQYDYVRSAKELGYKIILKNEEYGKDHLTGAIFARKGEGIESLDDLRGGKVVFGGGPTAMMSTIVPTYLLRNAGIADNDYQRDYAKNPPSAVFAAYYGHADASGAGDISTRIPIVTDKINVDELKPLAKSEPLAHLPWAVSPNIDQNTAIAISEAMVELKYSEEGRQLLANAGVTAFLPATDREYNPHRRMILDVLGEDYCLIDCDDGDGKSAVSDVSVLKMGIFPRRPKKMTETMFSPLADYLSEKLGHEVDLVVAKDFTGFWKGVTERQFDIVHFNQYHYVKSHRLYGYHAIARNEEQGQSMFRPVIWARKDSGVDSLDDLRGKKVIFGGGRTAMMAFIGPSYLLKKAGLEESDYESIFAINPMSGCRAMYLGQAAACGSGEIMFRLPALAKHVDINNLKIVESGEQLAFLVWAVRDTLPSGFERYPTLGLTEVHPGRTRRS